MFAERLKQLRNEQNITQSQLALKLGLTNKSISAYEKGTSTPSIETLHKIADYFHVSIDFLTGYSDTPNALNAAHEFNINEKTVDIIKHLSNIHMAEDIFSDLLQEPFFIECLEYLFVYISMTDEEWEDMTKQVQIPRNGKKGLPKVELIGLLKSTFKNRVSDSFMNAVDAIGDKYQGRWKDSGK